MTKVYLSGPIAGLPMAKVKTAFALAECEVVERIDDELMIVNPASLPPTCTSWADFLIRDLMMLKDCDIIAMLPNWQSSPGAKTEREFALGCGIKVLELSTNEA